MLRMLSAAGLLLAGVAAAWGFGHQRSGLRIAYVSVDDKGIMQIRELQQVRPIWQEITLIKEVDNNGVSVHEKFTTKVQRSEATTEIIHVDSKDVKVLDTSSKAVDVGKLPALFQREQAVLLSDNGRMPDANCLPLLKKGTFVVVFPGTLSQGGHGASGGGFAPEPKKMPPAKVVQ